MVKCNNPDCDFELDYPGQECPKCHSKIIFLNDSIDLSDDYLKLKIKDEPNYKSKKHPFNKEKVYKKEIYRDTGELNDIYREEDRVNDIYREVIKGPDGSIKINKTEKLSEHRGHGTAKGKIKKDMSERNDSCVLDELLKKVIIEIVKKKSNPTDLEKDIVDTFDEYTKNPFNMQKAADKIAENYAKYEDLFVKVNSLPTTIPKPSSQVTDIDLRYLLDCQLAFLCQKVFSEETNNDQTKNANA